MVSMVLDFRLPCFEREFYAFQKWDAAQSGYGKPTRHREFLLRNAGHIIPRTLGAPNFDLYESDYPSLAAMADHYSTAYVAMVHPWVERWFEWDSALELVLEDENLCGAWRQSALFWLLDRVLGRDAACRHIDDADGRSDYTAAQIHYLRQFVCSTENRGKPVGSKIN